MAGTGEVKQVGGQGPELLCAPEDSAPEARRTGQSGWPGSAPCPRPPDLRGRVLGLGSPALSLWDWWTLTSSSVLRNDSGLQHRALSSHTTPAIPSTHSERKGLLPWRAGSGLARGQGRHLLSTYMIVRVLRWMWPPRSSPPRQAPL